MRPGDRQSRAERLIFLASDCLITRRDLEMAEEDIADETLNNFVRRYEMALATQDWSEVAPLLHDDVCVTFSDGSVHRGKRGVQKAFERNFSRIQDEQYRIDNVHWVDTNHDFACYLFDFRWTGSVDGTAVAGDGRGTAVLKHDGKTWRLLAEHLGPSSAGP